LWALPGRQRTFAEWPTDYALGTTPLGRALWFDETDLAANRRGELGVAQRARLEQTRKDWQRYERLLQWVVRACYVGLGGFGLYWVVYAITSAEAEYLVGTLLCGLSALLTWKLFGTSTRVEAPPLPTQVLMVSGHVEVFTKAYGSAGSGTVLHFARAGGLTFAVLAGTAKAFQPGLGYRLYYLDYLPGFVAKSLGLNVGPRGDATLLSAEPIEPA
jgi:hypothetical protein